MLERLRALPRGARAGAAQIAAAADATAAQAACERIFWSTAYNPPDEPEAQAAYLWRWCARYAARWPDWFICARVPDARAPSACSPIVGYIAGCPQPLPDHSRPFALDPTALFADQLIAFPAHLHINVAPSHQSTGIGALLIKALAEDLRARRPDLRGLNAITAHGARNQAFYARNGFACVGPRDWYGTPLAMMTLRVCHERDLRAPYKVRSNH